MKVAARRLDRRFRHRGGMRVRRPLAAAGFACRPNPGSVPHERGRACTGARPVRDAGNEARGAIHSADRARDAYGDVGTLLLAARYLDTAEPALLNARALAPDDPTWPYYLAHLYRNRGALEQASAFLREVLVRRPDDLAALVWLASVSIEQGRYSDAEPLLDSALRRDPQSDAAHYHAGRLALARRDFATAARHLETALRRNNRASAAHYPLAMAYRGLGRQADADAELRVRDRRNAEIAPVDPSDGSRRRAPRRTSGLRRPRNRRAQSW